MGNNNTPVVQAIYAAFGQGDIPAILDRLHPQIHWSFYGPSTIPFAGEFHGHAGMQEFFGQVGATLEVQSFEPLEFTACDDRVVVLGQERVKVKATDKHFATQWAHVFTLRDGLVVRLQEYYDTAAIVAAFTAHEPASSS